MRVFTAENAANAGRGIDRRDAEGGEEGRKIFTTESTEDTEKNVCAQGVTP